MSDLRQFTADLNKAYDQKVVKNTVAVQKKLALEALRRVVLKSPVLTGRFRGNWQVSIGVRPDGTLELEDPSGGTAIQAGSRPIASLSKFDTIYIQNNLPYGPAIEDGSSKQAPGGVVAVTVAELEAFIDQITGR